MANLYRSFFISVLFLLSFNSWSNSLLSQHALAASQAVSAIYMYCLTDGDERYYSEYVEILAQAHDSFLALKKQNPEQLAELEPIWMEIQKEKDHKPSVEDEFNIDSFQRIHFRNYLEKVYQLLTKTIRSESNLAEQMSLVALDVEVMTARFFDVSSATMGVFSLSSKLFEVDPETMAKKMTQRLAKLQATVNEPRVKKDLRKISSKWQFIESSVINYNQEAAFMLVYYNKKKINKLILNSQEVLAGL